MPNVNPYQKTRIAPTPSGFLHLGNILSFTITTSLAQKTGAKILLRIDDLDQARVNDQYVQDIFDTLNFLEIKWDEGPRDAKDFEENWSQLHRMEKYRATLGQLAANGHVYACVCSRRQLAEGETCVCRDKHLPLDTENASWRFITSNDLISVKDYNGQITQAHLPADMQNFVVRKKDGFPAYQLTSVVDDLFYGVDLIVRGEDLWPSTLAQLMLAKALGGNNFGDIAFYHHPLLMETSGKKLSKSAGATSIKYLRDSKKDKQYIYALMAEMLGH